MIEHLFHKQESHLSKKSNLSIRQGKILEFIKEFQELRSYPPTIRDIQSACGISSTSVVDYNLKALEQNGYIKRDKEVSRGIEILVRNNVIAAPNKSQRSENNQEPFEKQTKIDENDYINVPILGYIAAGEPLFTITEDHFGQIEPLATLGLPKRLLRENTDVYALMVKGTSMIDALIDDGDVVVVKPTNSIQDGDMVVAWLRQENSVTLKRIYKERDRIRLQPANKTMLPIYVKPDNIQIQGKIVTVIRNT